MFWSVPTTDEANDLTATEHGCEAHASRELCNASAPYFRRMDSSHAFTRMQFAGVALEHCSSQEMRYSGASVTSLTGKAIFERYTEVGLIVVEV